MKNKIIEKQLGIKGDYQYQALRGKNILQSNWHNNKLVVIRYLINKYHTKTVLDLGTGSGNFELMFANSLKKIVGVDYNDEAIYFLSSQLKKNKIHNVDLFTRDILSLPTQKPFGKFDMIIMIDVIEHLDKVKEKKLIKYFSQVLNENGKIVIVTPNYSGIWPIVEKGLDLFGSVPHLENMQHVTRFDQRSLKCTFVDLGFKQTYSSTFNTFSFLLPDKNISSVLCKLELVLNLFFGSLLVSVFEQK